MGRITSRPPQGADEAGDRTVTQTLPRTLALVDDDVDYVRFLAQFLEQRGVSVRSFRDGDEFLTSQGAFSHDFYIIDLMLPGIDGVDLVRLIRRKGWAGIIVVSGKSDPDVFEGVMRAGADMHLTKPVRMEQVLLAVEAVTRRIQGSRSLADVWRLDRGVRTLVAPDGTRIPLSDTDFGVLECFVSAEGSTVTRTALCERLGRNPEMEPDNILHATIYRLRRRIEQSSTSTVPLRSEPRVGYTFRGKLTAE